MQAKPKARNKREEEHDNYQYNTERYASTPAMQTELIYWMHMKHYQNEYGRPKTPVPMIQLTTIAYPAMVP